jgi:hypothetical protein
MQEHVTEKEILRDGRSVVSEEKHQWRRGGLDSAVTRCCWATATFMQDLDRESPRSALHRLHSFVSRCVVDQDNLGPHVIEALRIDLL